MTQNSGKFPLGRRLSAAEALEQLKKRQLIAAEAPPPDLRQAVAGELQELVLKVLKLPVSEFKATTPLLEYGLDSIAATEIGTLFTERFGIVVPPTVFFEFPDVQSFSLYLVENHREALEARMATRPKVVPVEQATLVAPRPALVEQRPQPIAEAPARPASADPGTGLLAIEDLWSIGSTAEPPPFGSTLPPAEVKQPSRAELEIMMRTADQARIISIKRGDQSALECAIYGDGPPVLMLGGLLMHFSAMWRPQLAELGAKYRLVMFHMPGCGGVELRDGLTLSGLVGDVRDLLDALGLKAPLPVIGCSFGGVLAQAFCLAHPERCSALAVGVTTPIAEGATDFQKLMRELQTSSSFMEVNRKWPMASLPAYTKVIEGFDLCERLAEIRIPTLVVAGGRDQYTPPGHSKMIADRVPGATLIEVKDAGHLLPFTHFEIFNEEVLKFLARANAGAELGTTLAIEDQSVFLPASRAALAAAEAYVTNGDQGHCVILPDTAAELALLLSHICNVEKPEPVDYRSYFVTSLDEAFDAAIRLARHQARNKAPQCEGTIVVVDEGTRWKNYVDPLAVGAEEALLPGVHVVATVEEAERRLASGQDVVALVFVANGRSKPEAVDALFARLEGSSALGIFVEHESKHDAHKPRLVTKLKRHPDIVVFGEALTGFQAPFGACSVKASVANPWLMTPNEGYVRQPMAAMGLPIRLALDHLSATVRLTDEVEQERRRIRELPAAAHEAHLRYANVGYARVARMHGYDGRFFNAHGMRSQFSLAGGEAREIVDCLLNVGTCPRGLNPKDTIDAVFRSHDAGHDYWKDLEAFLASKTGFEVALPASSQTGAIESALALGLLAASGRSKVLCFSGGAGFSMISAATAYDPLFDLFRRPFRPIYPNVVHIDPKAQDAEARLRQELASGEIALVLLETIQVEGNAVRPSPAKLLELVVELREKGGYLVAVDETQTNLWTGGLLHSEALLPSPDIVLIGTALCDSLFPAGAVLTHPRIIDRARRRNAVRTQSLLDRAKYQLAAHLALHSLQTIFEQNLLAAAKEAGTYFKAALVDLTRQYPLLREVRGEGLLLAIELNLEGESAFVQRGFGYYLWGAMLRDREGGVAAVVCPLHNNCMRLVPSLAITRSEIDAVVANLRRRLSAGVDGVMRDCADYNLSLGERRTATFLTSQLSNKNERSSAMENAPIRALSGANVRPLKAHRGLPTVCIIGAGVGGIAMAGQLKKEGIPFDCFDKRERLGGIWAFDEKRQHTSVWHHLNMNTPFGLYQFSDFPMPASYPDYPQWHQVQAYLESYIDHLDMRSSFHLGREVKSARRMDGGRWRVELASGEVRIYDALVVANGHHNTPNLPAYADKLDFKGQVIHSQHYRYRHEYRDKRVMVVGVGNSGAQIAVDVSQDAKMTYVSLRRGVYLLPHYLFGFRIDKILGVTLNWWFKKMLPGVLYPAYFTGVYHLIGNHRKIGMPKPDHLMMTCLPTVSESLPNRIGDGKIKIVPEVKSAEGTTVHLADGSSLEVDAIIYSTGYQTTLPFFDKEFFEVKDNKVELYKRIFLPGVPNLAFVGMFQAIRWGFLDIMEGQAKIISAYFAGRYALPGLGEQKEEIAKELASVGREFMHTLRNNYYLHGDTYVRELGKELKRGARRAQSAGSGIPIECGGDVASGLGDRVPTVLSPAE
ncbi:MAG: aminotransferase class III-fold pyridoxal phosphate-dependent enzyme [Hyphomicrobium sp.]